MFGGSREIQGSEVALSVCEGFPTNRYELAKTIFDRVLAIVLLIVLSPAIMLVMLLVRLTSRGSPIYSQQRVGQNGQHFTIYKIRSMYVDSEVDGPRWSLPGDDRVTPIGRLLRSSHFDELPQLINVIRGEMSLIGPRPERPELIAQLEHALPHYHLRHRIRPGISGLAQVLQAPDSDLASVGRKLKYDIYYVDRLSLMLDARSGSRPCCSLLDCREARSPASCDFPSKILNPNRRSTPEARSAPGRSFHALTDCLNPRTTAVAVVLFSACDRDWL